MEDRLADAMALLDGCHQSAVAGGGGMASSFSEMRARYVVDSEDWDGPALSMAADYGDRAGPPLRDAWLEGYVAGVSGDAGSTRAALEQFRALRPAAEQEMSREGLTDETYQSRPEVLELQLQLSGDDNRQMAGDHGPVSVMQRIDVAELGTLFSTYGPTPTHLSSLEIGEQKFASIKTALDRIFNTDMPALRKAMDEAGVPWTPGRGVPGKE